MLILSRGRGRGGIPWHGASNACILFKGLVSWGGEWSDSRCRKEVKRARRMNRNLQLVKVGVEMRVIIRHAMGEYPRSL